MFTIPVASRSERRQQVNPKKSTWLITACLPLLIPLAAEITGFRHDELGFDDDIEPFTVLEKLFAAG